MKYNKIVRIVLSLSCMALIISLLSCNSCGKSEERDNGPKPTDFENAISNKDTLAVETLIDEFFTYAKDKEFSKAAAMLYCNMEDPNGEPQPLDNEQMEDVCRMLNSIPMVDYKIEYIKFNEFNSNEVMCYVIIMKGDGDMPDVTTKMFFKPINYLGNWLLCLTNSDYGDRGLVDPDKRDSLKNAFNSK